MVDMGRDRFSVILTEIDSSSWEMARVRECWKIGRPSPAVLPINADWTENMRPLEKLWWGESDLHSPLARLPCLVREAEQQLRLLCMHCQYGAASRTVKSLGQSKCIHRR